jgi:Tol biopolymer transport system component
MKLAFTAKSEHVRTWIFPFDVKNARISGDGHAVTSSAGRAVVPALSRDSKKLVFGVERSGTWELWQKSLADGREAPISTDEYERTSPQWSPDGTRLAYQREKHGDRQLMMWNAENRIEEPLTSLENTNWQIVCDWSPDGTALLVSQGNDRFPSPEPRMRKLRPEKLSPVVLPASSNRTSLQMGDGLPSRRRPILPRV